MSDSTVVFDLARDGIQGWWFGLPGLLIAGVCYALYTSELHTRSARRSFQKFGIGFGLLFFAFNSVFTVLRHWSFTRAIQNRQYQQVEGIVQDFTPGQPQKPARRESFVVDGHRISYSPFEITGGYAKFSTPQGPIFQGQRVRVRLVGETVVYLEILPRQAT